jgi:protein-L-isoaspartate(D-aspartate) O-methyltransferase
MTELAQIDKNSRVLEIGTGSGYQAAVLGEIAREVYSIEIVESLGKTAQGRLKNLGYENIQVRIGDGYKGWPEAAPFDAILVTAAPDHIPQPLLDQLKSDGRLVIPVGELYQELEVVFKQGDELKREKVIPVRFVPMTGEAQED